MNNKNIKAHIGLAVTCFFLMAVVYVPFFSLIGLYVEPIAGEFDIESTTVSLMITISILSSMVSSFFAGSIFNSIGIKYTVIMALGIIALSYLGMYFAKSIFVLYLLAVPRGFCITLISMIPISILVNNWFDERIKGKITGIIMMGTGIGIMGLSPVSASIIASASWHFGFVFYGVLAAVMILPVLFTFTTRPEDKGFKKLGASDDKNIYQNNAEIKGISFKQSLISAGFWIAVFAFFSISGTTQTWQNLGAAYFENIGITTMRISLLLSVSSIGNMIGKIILGAVCDKWGAEKGAILAAGEMCAGCILLLLSRYFVWLVYPGVIFIGLGLGFVNITIPLLTAKWFGNKEFGRILGCLHAAASIGASVLPLCVSMYYDNAPEKQFMWIFACLFCVITSVCIIINRRICKRYK